MNKALICLLILISSISAFGQAKTFYDHVFSSDCWDCFVAFSVESKSYSGRVVVENVQLYQYLKAARGFDEQKYKQFMFELLKNNRNLKMQKVTADDTGFFLKGKGLREHSFRIINDSKYFETIFSMGCDELLDYYFAILEKKEKPEEKEGCRERIKRNEADLLMYPKFGISEQNNVLGKLFELQIPVNLDDISGSLKISHFRVSKIQ